MRITLGWFPLVVLLLPASSRAETARQQLERQPGAQVAAAAAANPQGIAVEEALSGPDLSKDYLSAFEKDETLNGEDIRKLRSFKILLIPGFLSNRYPIYFDDQLMWFKSVQIEAEYVKINSEGSPEANAKTIANRIRASTKPVLIVSHSKGSLDTWIALLADPTLTATTNGVKGWVSLQGAFRGSPVADFIIEHSLTGPDFGARLWNLIGGTRESLLSLMTESANERFERTSSATKDLVAAIPIIAFVSWGPSSSPGLSHQVLSQFSRWMSQVSGPNDGLMTVNRASLPGMAVVKAADVDHADPVMRDPLTPASEDTFDRVRMTKALLSLLLSRMPPATR